MIFQSCSFSRAGSVAVGSSRISNLTSCRRQDDFDDFALRHGQCGKTGTSRSKSVLGNHLATSALAVCARRLARMMPPFCGSAPSRMFSAPRQGQYRTALLAHMGDALGQCGTRRPDPDWLAILADAAHCGCWLPPSTLTSVDLPAPFSPMMPCTSSVENSTLTPSSARVPGNCTLMSCRAICMRFLSRTAMHFHVVQFGVNRQDGRTPILQRAVITGSPCSSSWSPAEHPCRRCLTGSRHPRPFSRRQWN